MEDLQEFANIIESLNEEYDKLYEEKNNIVYKCLAPSYEEKDIDVKIDEKSLEIKSLIEKSVFTESILQ